MSRVHELYHQAVIARRPTIQVLASLRLFEGIDPVDLTDMTVTMRTRRHRAGEVIFHQGEPGDALHVIVGGMVKLVLPSPSGDEAILATVAPASVLRRTCPPRSETSIDDGCSPRAD